MAPPFMSLDPEEYRIRLYRLRNKWAIWSYLQEDPYWYIDSIESETEEGWNAQSYINTYDTFDT